MYGTNFARSLKLFQCLTLGAVRGAETAQLSLRAADSSSHSLPLHRPLLQTSSALPYRAARAAEVLRLVRVLLLFNYPESVLIQGHIQ